MKNKQAFTLIELLVVVLIIGILAAVALPQYQKAVYKARYTQGITWVESIWQAEQRYFLANGNYTDDVEELDIDVPAATSYTREDAARFYYPWGTCQLHNGGKYVACKMNLGSSATRAWYKASYKLPNRECWAEPQEDKRANEFCKFVTKTTTGTPNGTNYMIYNFN